MFPRTLLNACAVLGLALCGPARAGEPGQASADFDRRHQESERLKERLAERDAEIGALERELAAAREAAASAALQVKALRERCESLRHEADRVRAELNAARTRGGLPEVMTAPALRLVVGGLEALPGRLQLKLHGRVVATGGRSGLLEISVGAGDGVRKGQVFDVYRLVTSNPRASLYLGQVTVVETTTNRAVGRYEPALRDRAPLPGDEVALAAEQNEGR